MNIVFYARGNSFDKQIEICEDYAAGKEFNVLGVIDDLEQLSEFPNCNALLVSKRNRISRDVFAVQLTDFRLREKGIKIISADGDTGRSSVITSALISKLNATQRNES